MFNDLYRLIGALTLILTLALLLRESALYMKLRRSKYWKEVKDSYRVLERRGLVMYTMGIVQNLAIPSILIIGVTLIEVGDFLYFGVPICAVILMLFWIEDYFQFKRGREGLDIRMIRSYTYYTLTKEFGVLSKIKFEMAVSTIIRQFCFVTGRNKRVEAKAIEEMLLLYESY